MVVETTATTTLRLNLVYHPHLTFLMKVHSFLLELSNKQNKQQKGELISNSNRHKPQR